jgi:hypothetical protein
VEQRGGIGQKSAGMLIRQGYVMMFEILAAYADDSVYQIDPARADEIPLRGAFVRNPHGRE